MKPGSSTRRSSNLQAGQWNNNSVWEQIAMDSFVTASYVLPNTQFYLLSMIFFPAFRHNVSHAFIITFQTQWGKVTLKTTNNKILSIRREPLLSGFSHWVEWENHLALLMERIYQSTPNELGTYRVATRCATEAYQYHLCTTYIEDYEGWWLPGVLCSTPGDCWPFHFPLFLRHNV